MAKLIAVNNGPRTQAIRVAGGLRTIKPGGEIEVVPDPDLDDGAIRHFLAVGVTFRDPNAAPAPTAKSSRRPSSRKPSAEKDAAVKAAAEAAVVAAEVEKTGDDMVAKAEAEKVLKDAEAALEALKEPASKG